MRRLVWAADARSDLEAIYDYISDYNVAAADRLQSLIVDTAEQLPRHPFLYRQGRTVETREAVVHPNYILVYRVFDDRVRVLRILHARRRYP